MLPKVITVLLVASAVWMLAGAIWQVIPFPSLPPTPAQKTEVASTNKPAVNVAALIRLNLFGKAESKTPVITKTNNADAPETRLNLVLAGIILSEDENLSRALIAGSNGKQKTYGVGETVDGSNAEIDEIHAEHIVLVRGGRYETLRLQKITNKSTASAASKTTSAATNNTSSVVGDLKSVREQILKDPSKAGDFIRVRPVYSKGQLRGYRIYPGKDRALYRKVGLRSGDLVTSINGQSLTDPQKAFSMLSTLSSATTITLELLRRGHTENVSVDLSQ